VVSKGRLIDNCSRIKAAFLDVLPGAELFYSYKTNCVPGVLSMIHSQGIGAEVISPYELWLALRLGLPGGRILYNGPHKSRESLQVAIQRDLRAIHADSLADLREIAAVSRAVRKAANVGLRLRPTRGWIAQLGLSLTNGEAAEAFRFLEEHRDLLRLKALHMHLGSQITDPSLHAAALDEILAFLRGVSRTAPSEVECLDVGGGFGVPTVRETGGLERRLCRFLRRPLRAPHPERCPTLSSIAESIRRALERNEDLFPRGRPKVLVEPGRAITSSAQVLLLGVRALKKRKPAVAILDGGKLNITYPASFEYHHLLVANRMREPAATPYQLFGRTCTPSDVLYDRVVLPALSEGDVIAVMDAGAYFTSFSSDFAYPRPPVLMVHRGATTVLREREHFYDLVARDRDPWPGAGSVSERADARTRAAREYIS
jgi:diaminopimelate decarboxylase